MIKFYRPACILVYFALLLVGCNGSWVQPASEFSNAGILSVDDYQSMLGKLMDDRDVLRFLDTNDCVAAGQFQNCSLIGVSIWTDHHRMIKKIYLYVDSTDYFSTYKGELPFGLTANDTMESVEKKFGQPKVPQVPQLGSELGVPERGGTPDYFYYWAIYDRFNITIVYGSPSAQNRNAGIHMILVNAELSLQFNGPIFLC